jgi:hypothetical protein
LFFDRREDLAPLHTRIDELERRLAILEEQARESRSQARLASEGGEDRRDRSERRFGRRQTDRLHRVSNLEEVDPGREGARLVALEMLEAGHRPDDVSTYLRETFGLDEESAALAVSGRVTS